MLSYSVSHADTECGIIFQRGGVLLILFVFTSPSGHNNSQQNTRFCAKDKLLESMSYNNNDAPRRVCNHHQWKKCTFRSSKLTLMLPCQLPRGSKGCWFGGKLIQKLRQKGVYEESFSRHAAWIGGKLIQFMHTTMVPVQVKTMKIQAGVQVSRQGELRRHLQLWKCFGRLYFLNDLDHALRIDPPAALTAESTADQKRAYKQWERSNRMSLMIIKNSISVAIRGAIPDSENEK
ncbi:hypothetical protein Tco_0367401 [Tanacetum coccineum]